MVKKRRHDKAARKTEHKIRLVKRSLTLRRDLASEPSTAKQIHEHPQTLVCSGPIDH